MQSYVSYPKSIASLKMHNNCTKRSIFRSVQKVFVVSSISSSLAMQDFPVGEQETLKKIAYTTT